MPDPAAATATQLRNIEQATGMTMADFASAVAAHSLEGHARIVAFLKTAHGLSHGNANAVALKVREMAAGGPSPASALLDAQYAGGKAALRPIFERLTVLAQGMGPDVDIVVQRTGVALRRRRQFGLIQAPSAKRLTLGLNLEAPSADPRLVPTPGAMCTHRVDITEPAAVDEAVEGWLRDAYERAG